ncbi:MAG: tubulin-like doman-containing protein [Defluviitaleaceae bacterium]|nr:tubulin-like doman-containing protein [Defluviitaleaceae bacterium]
MPEKGPDVKQVVDAFRELDITVGNGLIGESQLLEPAKRALFIGLGGTGCHALRRLKRIIYQRYKNVEKNFAFFGVDTDTTNPRADKDYMLLTQDEKVELSANEDYFDPRKRDLIPDYIREWLDDDVSYAVRGDGAGGKRAVARALLFSSSNTMVNKFENSIQKIRTGDPNARIDVFIMAGIGGGTGSGTMLDTAYMLRKILSNVQHNIHGFIFMPDINTSVPLPDGTKRYIPPNAFAALKEIDYWMNIIARDDTFRQQYAGGFAVEEKKPPFDCCWPLTATNSNGMLVVDALNQASTVAAEVICAWIAFKEEAGATNNFIQSFQSNVSSIRDIYLNGLYEGRKGRSFPVCFDYTVCGASVAKLPIAAINTYLACVLFRRFKTLYDRAFTDQVAADLPKFCADKTIAVEYDQVKRLMDTKFSGIGLRLPDLADRTYKDLFESDAERIFIHHLEKVGEQIEGIKMKIVEEKLEAMNMAFKDIFIDTNRGPYYLNVFIQNGNTGLIAMLENYKKSAKNEKSRIENVLNDLEREKNNTYKNGKKAIFITQKTHVQQYSEAMRRYYSSQRDLLLCDACMAVYDAMGDMLQRRVNALYKSTYAVLDALSSTFQRNINTFDSEVEVTQKANVTEYSWDIIELPDIVLLVEETLNKHGMGIAEQDQLVQDLLADLLNLIDAELNRFQRAGDLNDISLQGLDVNKFLANFVADKFKVLTQRNLKDYLEVIASKENKTLEEYLVAKFQEMERDASPLFATHPAGASKLYYSAIPMSGMADIKKAWETYSRGDRNRQAFPSDNEETLVFMTIGCATALYEASQLEEAETAFNSFMRTANVASSLRLVSGTKLSREKGNMDEFWDWRNLPSPIPADQRPDNSQRTKDRDWESTCKSNVKRLFDKNLLRSSSTTGKCSYTRLIDLTVEGVKKAMSPGEITPTLPIATLRGYRDKLKELVSYVNGTERPPNNIRERYGMFFGMIPSEFSGAVHPDWEDPNHEVVTVYSRALNIQRELQKTEKFFDSLVEMVAEVEKIIKEVSSSAEVAELIAKGFLCGVFTINGKQFQYMDKDGEAQTLSRVLADKYPICAFYEKFIKLREKQDILDSVDLKFAEALDVDKLDKETFAVFKDSFKKELKQLNESESATDSQRYLLDRINEFILSNDL